jgi:hypothetical protein
MTAPTCSGPLRCAATCQECGEYGGDRHVNRTYQIDDYGAEISTPRIVCAACCRICPKEEK